MLSRRRAPAGTPVPHQALTVGSTAPGGQGPRVGPVSTPAALQIHSLETGIQWLSFFLFKIDYFKSFMYVCFYFKINFSGCNVCWAWDDGGGGI